MKVTKKVCLALLAVVAAVLAGCASTPEPLHITLRAQDILWDMHEIHAKVNQPVELTIRNDGALDHDLVIEALGVDLLLSPGDVEIITFTIDHATTIEFICNIPGHEEAGMVGHIIISE